MYRKFISRYLGNIHLTGFEYIIRACELYKAGHSAYGIYRKIAKEIGVSECSVERDIRYYISNMKKNETYKLLKPKIHSFKNREVIAAIVYTVDADNADFWR